LIRWFAILGVFYIICIGVEFFFAANFIYSLTHYDDVRKSIEA
jgi:hypothetical protein